MIERVQQRWRPQQISRALRRAHQDAPVVASRSRRGVPRLQLRPRFDGVRVVHVDEHVRRHTRRGAKYVTVIIDLTAICTGTGTGTGTARLLDMVAGRSKQAFKTWLAERPEAWRNAVEVVAMDGFTGFKTATTEESPMRSRSSIPSTWCAWLTTHSTRTDAASSSTPTATGARKDDPLYRARRTLHTGADLLPEKRRDRLEALFATDAHVEVEATWRIYQRMIAAYRAEDRKRGRELLVKLIDSIGTGVPKALTEIITWAAPRKSVQTTS